MFTGLIQKTAKVISAPQSKKGGVLCLEASFSDVKIGESIAIDGCCLTVTKQQAKKLFFDVSDETMAKSVIGFYKKGRVVNLERALKASERLGGHFVLGHVDGLGRVKKMKRTKGSLQITFMVPGSLAKYVIEKGSVTVDGISLTACEVTSWGFSVYIIPHTEKETNLGFKKVGDFVNIETDVLGKYVEKLFGKSLV